MSRTRPHPSGRDQGRPQGLRRLRLGGLQGRSRLGAAAQGRGPRLLDTRQEPLVRACPRAAVAGRARRQGRRPHQRAGRRSGAGAHGARAPASGACSRRWTRSRGRADRDRGGLAARSGHDALAGARSRLSIWDEPGLEIEGFDEPPTVMMGHHRPEYRSVDRGRRLREGQGPLTYEVDIELAGSR